MENKRILDLRPRVEHVRDEAPVVMPVRFTLSEIREHFEESMQAVKALGENVSDDMNCCQTVWRSQVALSAGLLDFYLHEISKYCLLKMFIREWKPSDKYASMKLKMSTVEKALETADLEQWFFSYVNDLYSGTSFLSKEHLKEQLNIIGIGWNDVLNLAFSDEEAEESIADRQTMINQICERRHMIVHQADRNHATAQQNDITEEFVTDYITKIENIVNAIQYLAEKKRV